MKAKLILLLAMTSVFAMTAQTKKFTFYFPSGKQTPANIKAFNDSLAKWKHGNAHIVSIKGYADSKGSDALNQKLSQKRSLKTDSILRKIVSSDKKATVSAFGEKHPVATNKTKTGRAKNRRVEVEIEFVQPPLVEDIVLKEEKPIVISVQEREDTTFILPNGTEIIVKKCALKGSRFSEVKIDAVEYLTPASMIANGMLSQTADGSCLRTGGMIQYSITNQNGKALSIDKNCPVDISVPVLSTDTTMDLYDLPEQVVTKGKPVHGDRWRKMDRKVKYNKKKKTFNYSMDRSAAYINCDKYRPSLGQFAVNTNFFSWVFGPKAIVKTKQIKNAEVFVSGDASVMRLTKISARKHSKLLCDCIPYDKQYLTVTYEKNKKFYLLHKKVSELQALKDFGKKLLVRKKEFTQYNSREAMNAALEKAVVPAAITAK